LTASQHIVILADNKTLIIDYHAKVHTILPIVAQCVTNWGDGFLLAKENSSSLLYFRFEDQKYVQKF